ncbi:hypothetical protein [Tamlana crocina]|uniref:Uncharacterized protein n=1 Tax=Tamlana crocina TaxID=393006 RepID=A0ABX1DGG2_9FLAO|nr:hypothetical protein [Tamlana crocina]NJX16371.1 hypothetical protein [Tamlana crocina]
MDKVSINKELSKSSLPDLSTLISYEDYRNQTVTKKIDSVIKTQKDFLQMIMEDKSLVKINPYGLFLTGYEIISSDESTIDNILNTPITEKTYLPIYIGKDKNTLNEFVIKQPFTINNMKKPEVVDEIKRQKDIIKFRLLQITDSQYQLLRLEWDYHGKKFFTNAVFSGKELIYDEILSNLSEINYIRNCSSDEPNMSKKSNIKNVTEDCSTTFNIFFYDEIMLTREGLYGSGSYAYARITVSGEQWAPDCTKYIQSKSTEANGYYQPGYSGDSKAKIINFTPAGMYYYGSCDYELAAVISNYAPFSTSITLSWNGSEFTVTGGSWGHSFQSKGNYVTPDMLN